MTRWLLLFLASFSLCFAQEKAKSKVGLCIVATGRYAVFAEELIESARPFFCTDSDVTYFVFTDGQIKPSKDVVKIFQKRLGWPYDTLKRFEIYERNKDALKEMDYLFALDADMKFVAPVGEEILGDLVGTLHPGWVGKKGTFENHKISTAYVTSKLRKSKSYFCGGFYGGKRENFFKLIHKTNENIDKDLAKNYIATWHDESHLNRYFIDHKPTVILSPAYCYPEKWDLPYPKKILALDKDHKEFQKAL